MALSNAMAYREVVKLRDRLADDNRYLNRELVRISGDEIVGADFGLKEVMRHVRQVAPTDSPVLITGETGVGKDVVANAIHLGSPRRDGPFIAVNCGAIADDAQLNVEVCAVCGAQHRFLQRNDGQSQVSRCPRFFLYRQAASELRQLEEEGAGCHWPPHCPKPPRSPLDAGAHSTDGSCSTGCLPG